MSDTGPVFCTDGTGEKQEPARRSIKPHAGRKKRHDHCEYTESGKP